VFLEGELESFDSKRIENVLDVNLKGTIFVTKAALPLLKKSPNAMILNVASTSGLRGRPHETVYCASKWGVQGFTESLKLDLAGTNVRVIGFYPGGMNTPFFEKAESNRPTDTYMNPKDVAEVVAFILNESTNLSIEHVVVNKRSV
jgi:NADP-dependent 3-hydroxy acid dehydrogenase YdfG